MIVSPSNPHVKRIRSLAADRKVRRRERLFVLEGVRLVADVLESGASLPLVLYAPEQLDATAEGQALRERLEQIPGSVAAGPAAALVARHPGAHAGTA